MSNWEQYQQYIRSGGQDPAKREVFLINHITELTRAVNSPCPECNVDYYFMVDCDHGDHIYDRRLGDASITCPRCGMTSHHPDDVTNLYCGNCHEFHSSMSENAVEIIQVLVTPALRPAFEEWLRDRGLSMGRIPDSQVDPDSLPTYVISPSDELLAAYDAVFHKEDVPGS